MSLGRIYKEKPEIPQKESRHPQNPCVGCPHFEAGKVDVCSGFCKAREQYLAYLESLESKMNELTGKPPPDFSSLRMGKIKGIPTFGKPRRRYAR